MRGRAAMSPIIDVTTAFRLAVHIRRYLVLIAQAEMPRFGVLIDHQYPSGFGIVGTIGVACGGTVDSSTLVTDFAEQIVSPRHVRVSLYAFG